MCNCQCGCHLLGTSEQTGFLGDALSLDHACEGPLLVLATPRTHPGASIVSRMLRHLLTYACPLVTSVCPPVPVNSCSGHLIPATFPRILPTPSAMGSPFLGIPSTLSPKPEHLPPHRLHARDGLRPSFIYRSLGQGHNPTWVRPHCPAGKSGQSVCVPPRCRSHGRQPDVGDRAGHSARPECTWAVLAWAVRVAKCNRLKVASEM